MFLQGFIIAHSNHVHISDLTFINSPQMHMAMERSTWEYVYNLTITAPGDSPNTDGIHIQHSTHVFISQTHIGTGILSNIIILSLLILYRVTKKKIIVQDLLFWDSYIILPLEAFCNDPKDLELKVDAWHYTYVYFNLVVYQNLTQKY